jgi:serine/threonine protein kinase
VVATIPQPLRDALSGRYELVREIGRGGMATVYLARDARHPRDVAVKVLRPELAASLGVDRFLKEIAIAAALTHPHILTLIDSGQADQILYYVMPFVDGESVRGLLNRKRRLGLDESIPIIRAVSDAVTYAHRKGVVHRDLKPENILLSEGHAVVTDFGIAKAISTAGVTNLTRTGFPLGTPGYMSPEQAAGRTDLDPTTDVYGLACVFYEMVVGDTPGLWVSDESARMERFLDALPAHRERLDRLPGSLEQVLIRALAMRPADRYRTPNEFALALDRAAGTKPRYSPEEARAIIRRAAEQQAQRPTEDGALSIGGVEQIAADVGISPRRVRQAVGDLRSASPKTFSAAFLGGRTTLTYERFVEGEVPEQEFEVFVEEIRATIGNVGQVSSLGRSVAWTSTHGPHGGVGRDVHVTITPRAGRTRIRVEERMGGLAGGLFGGIMGGGGGGIGPAATAILIKEVGAAVVVGLGVGALVVGGCYALARTIYTSVNRKRARELEDLIDRMTEYAERVAMPAPHALDNPASQRLNRSS